MSRNFVTEIRRISENILKKDLRVMTVEIRMPFLLKKKFNTIIGNKTGIIIAILLTTKPGGIFERTRITKRNKNRGIMKNTRILYGRRDIKEINIRVTVIFIFGEIK